MGQREERVGADQTSGHAGESDRVVVGNGCLLVGLVVSGTPAADDQDGKAPRWQVLTLEDGLIADIRGIDNRSQAAARRSAHSP